MLGSVTGTSTPTGSLEQARAGHTATLLPDGRVLVLDSSDYTAGLRPELWDPASGSFSPAGSLIEAREWDTATLLPDGRVLVDRGATSDQGCAASAEVWDPDSRTSGPAGSLAEPRSGHTATLLPDGRVLVIGGARPRTSPPSIAQLCGLSSPEPSLPIAHRRRGPSTDERRQEVRPRRTRYRPRTLAGPFRRSLRRVPTRSRPGAGTRHPRPGPSVRRVRSSMSASTTPRHSCPTAACWSIGGVSGDGEDSVILASTESFDPATGAFSPAGSLIDARIYHTATLLPDGRVLLVGGLTMPPETTEETTGHRVMRFIPAAEIRDPASGTSIPTGSLVQVRFDHTATLLRDGRVLVLGGDGCGRASTRLRRAVGPRHRLLQLDGIACRAAHRPYRHAPARRSRPRRRRAWHRRRRRRSSSPPPSCGTRSPGTSARPDRSSRHAEGTRRPSCPTAGSWSSGARATAVSGHPCLGRALGPGHRVVQPGRVARRGTERPHGDAPARRPGPRRRRRERSGEGRLASAEVWDPATGAFSPAGSLCQARARHTATLLPDGRVLVVGGDGGGGVLASAELWGPGSALSACPSASASATPQNSSPPGT